MPSLKLKILSRSPETGIHAGGLKFGFFFFIVMIAAINTGNNLTYLILAFLSGAVLVSWTLAALSLRGISASLKLPPEVYAGEQTRIEFVVFKRAGLLPGLSLTFSLKTGHAKEKAARERSKLGKFSIPGLSWLGGEKRQKRDAGPPSHQPYLARIGQGETRKIQGLFRFPRRGIYSLTGVHVLCNYPFGLISLGKLFKHNGVTASTASAARNANNSTQKAPAAGPSSPDDEPEELVVFPSLLPFDRVLETSAHGLASVDSPLKGRDGGLLNIRPFVPGDDYRQLHWKASAKLDRLMLKEFAQEEGHAFWLHFNPIARAPVPGRAVEIFELAVSYAATAAHYGRTMNLKMLFSAPGLDSLRSQKSEGLSKSISTLRPSRNVDHVRLFLRYLAKVNRKIAESESEIGRPALPSRRRGDEALLVIDPLNEDIDWGEDATVLGSRFFQDMLEGQR